MKGSASTDESVTAATEEGIDEVIASRLVSWQKIPQKASSIYFLGQARGMPPTFLIAVSYVTQKGSSYSLQLIVVDAKSSL